MLNSLTIENVAVIKKQTVDFAPGFNVFSGETGAGKSVLIDSINAVTGSRLARDIVRFGENSALISAEFSGLKKSVLESIASEGVYPDADGRVTISRRIGADGRSTCRVNGEVVSLSILKKIGGELINIHGQHDSQILLRPDSYYLFLDRLSGSPDKFDKYAKTYAAVVAADREIKRLSAEQSGRESLASELRETVSELDAANVTVGEYDALKKKSELIRKREKLASLLAKAAALLSGSDADGAVSMAQSAARLVEKAAEADEELAAHAAAVADAASVLGAEADHIGSELEELEFYAAEADRIESRLASLEELFSKYGVGEKHLLEVRDDAAARLEGLDPSGAKLAEKKHERNLLARSLISDADELTAARSDAAEKLGRAVNESLKDLSMPNAVFEVRLTQRAYGPTGRDDVEFLFSANPGSPPSPISKVASGGELSRLMLALKEALTDADDVDTLIFDEIDSGVSGRAATAIASKMRAIAAKRQVLCVTHLAQISAAADRHFLIEKTVRNGETFAETRELDYEGRVEENARIIGGMKVTQAGRLAAKQLIESAASGKG
ncbi:MAG: DNA repair protein RecN [Clostridia bacterium]|nr:DNA repair protein RecN [Clostridia bacterium]